MVLEHAVGLRPDARYRPPGEVERRKFVIEMRELHIIGQVNGGLAQLGFTVTFDEDPATGRRYALVDDEPGSEWAWGLYLVDLSGPPSVLVEVPHPNSDLRTEEVGLAMWRAVPGAMLAVSGTHRRVGGGAGDVAHRTDSMFHAIAVDHARRGVPQVQFHGFDDGSLPGVDVVVSVGNGRPGPIAREAADGIADKGLDVCVAWRSNCGELEGFRNKQGSAAADHDAVFLHVELSRSTRDTESAWLRAVMAIAVAGLADR
ncbi:hypothetical protein NLX83_22460 [Allokutzneria sp. A3M-2-11 16]|uniref:hypothetical protein n=1 Tax=Allokutzneria sp. A3M-2-11 16 TaxID=2962043 RepID=UPI0020B7D603|nr:hypothetical protein [Allokutzneria sp. A3M-2-11 16]MCP3802033.1 hypothetical protein [Allokutzneria sp. A3M-2-11 16]